MAGNTGPKTNFTAFDLQRIREMLQNGLSQAEVARAYDVHPATISRLVQKHNLNVAQSPQTGLEQLLAKTKRLHQLYDEYQEAYHEGDTVLCAELDAEIAELNPPTDRCYCQRPDCEACWGTE